MIEEGQREAYLSYPSQDDALDFIIFVAARPQT